MLTLIKGQPGLPGPAAESILPTVLNRYTNSSKKKRGIEEKETDTPNDSKIADCTLIKEVGLKLRELVNNIKATFNSFMTRTGTYESPAFSCEDLKREEISRSNGNFVAFIEIKKTSF